jgi:hypothetical protein
VTPCCAVTTMGRRHLACCRSTHDPNRSRDAAVSRPNLWAQTHMGWSLRAAAVLTTYQICSVFGTHAGMAGVTSADHLHA